MIVRIETSALRAGLLLAVSFLVSADTLASTGAADRRRAGQLYELGMNHMEAGSPAQAAVAFDQAFRLDASSELIWNAARAFDEAGDLETARARYRAFLERADAPKRFAQSAAQRLAEIDRELEERRSAVSEREREQLAALHEQLLSEVRAELEAWGRAHINQPAPTRDRVYLSSPGVGAKVEPKAPMGGWIVGGVGVAALLAGAGLHLHVASLNDTLRNPVRNDAQVIISPTQAKARELQAQADNEAIAGWTSVAVGGALVITAVVLLIEGGSRAEAAEAPSVHISARRDGARIGVSVGF